MKRILCAFTAVGLLAACTTTEPKPIVVSRTQIVQSAQLSLAAVEAGVAAYQTEHAIPPDVLAKLHDADKQAHALIADLQNAPADDIPNRAQIFATAIQALAASIPPGILPIEAKAGLVAFGALAQVIAQTVPQKEPGVVLSTGPVPPSTPIDVPPPIPVSPAAEAAAVGATPPAAKITN